MVSLFALLWLGDSLTRGVYLLAFSAIVGLAACVIGATAIAKARRTDVYRPRGALGGIIMGAVALLTSVPVIAVYLAFPSQTDQLVRCLSTANTSAAWQACDDQFRRSANLGSLSHASQTRRLEKHAPESGQGPGQGRSAGPRGR